jgi:Protein of unknown function (DUF2927)
MENIYGLPRANLEFLWADDHISGRPSLLAWALPAFQPGNGKARMISPRLLSLKVGSAGLRLGGICAAAFVLAATFFVGNVTNQPAYAENPDVFARRNVERTSFTDDEIMDGFYKIAFGAELQLGQRVERIRKFDEPVRIFVDNRARPDRQAEIATVVADIRTHIANLDIAITDDRRAANFVVTLVKRRDLQRTIRDKYGRDTGNQIEQSLAPQCLSGIGKDEQFRIRRAEVILPIDAGDFTFYDCAYEELLQALGAINDNPSVPWTMFNDDVQMGFFDVYDQYLLNILYDARVRAGMTKETIATLAPQILPSVRAWVAKINALRADDLHASTNVDARPPAAISE